MDQCSDRRSSSSGQNIPICFTKWTVLFLIHLSLLINLIVNEEDVKTQTVMVQSGVIWLTKAHNGELFWRWRQTFNFSSLPSRRTGIYTSVFVTSIQLHFGRMVYTIHVQDTHISHSNQRSFLCVGCSGCWRVFVILAFNERFRMACRFHHQGVNDRCKRDGIDKPTGNVD